MHIFLTMREKICEKMSIFYLYYWNNIAKKFLSISYLRKTIYGILHAIDFCTKWEKINYNEMEYIFY